MGTKKQNNSSLTKERTNKQRCYGEGLDASYNDALTNIPAPKKGINSKRAQTSSHPMGWWAGYQYGLRSIEWMKNTSGRDGHPSPWEQFVQQRKNDTKK